VGGHAAAALFHHLVHKDDILRRMLPARANHPT
jgi:cytochrome b561